MSRPFSYNDENFTVIGNVLFCHIKIKKAILKDKPFVEIPPEIYAHMLFTTQRFNQVQDTIGLNYVYTYDVGVKTEDKKYFLFTNSDIYETGTYLVGFYILKDI